MKKSVKVLSWLMIAAMLFSLFSFSAFAAPEKPEIKAGLLSNAFKNAKSAPDFDENEIVRAIVIYEGNGTVARVPSARISGAESKKRSLAAVNRQHVSILNKIENLSVKMKVRFEYKTLLNGIAVDASYADLQKIAAVDGVKKVYLANHYDLPDDKIEMESSNNMTGAIYMHTDGQTGKGTVIAVLDTGISPEHEAFGVYEGVLADELPITQTIADEYASSVGYGVYLSDKIPFARDYYDQDDDVTDNENGHGSHVAGIAAGYAREGDAVTFCGTAPGAQILALKVFSSDPEIDGTDDSVYFAALEDAYNLNADVINMSLGTQNGFTYDSSLENEIYGDIYAKIREAGIVLCAAAGNEFSMAEYNDSLWLGGGYVTSDYTDYGVVGSPSTYPSNLSVAAVENGLYMANVFNVNGECYGFSLPEDGPNFTDIFPAGNSYAYVPVPGYGEENDYEGLDVSGKIALISRGSITFTEKVNNAAEQGAIGVIVYNNQPGIFGMLLKNTTVPAISVTNTDGLALAALYAENPDLAVLTISDKLEAFENPFGWLVCDFSSWGSTSDLAFKPEIAGIGGNVYSVEAGTENGYITMSGTSMATPNIAGCFAIAIGYERSKNAGSSKKEIAEAVRAHFEATAAILVDADGYVYSPRKQGAGLIDFMNYESAAATVLNPLITMGDNENGVYDLSVEIKNLSEEQKTFELEPELIFDYAMPYDANGDEEVEYYNTLTSDFLIIEEDFSVAGETVITLNAGETGTVNLRITLKEETAEHLYRCFPNGTYIEGYFRVFEQIGESLIEQAHATVLGFLGDWEAAPIFSAYDSTDVVDAINTIGYYEMMEYIPSGEYSYLDLLDFQYNADINWIYLFDFWNNELIGFPGDNIFEYMTDDDDKIIPFNPDLMYISSPDSEYAIADSYLMYPALLRNARHVIMTVTDEKTGELYYVDDDDYISKNYYDTDYSEWTSESVFFFDGTDAKGNALPDGTEVRFNFYANLPGETDVLGAINYEDLLSAGKEYVGWTFTAVVDGTVPAVDEENIVFDRETGTVTIPVSDNGCLANAYVYNQMNDELFGAYYYDDTPGTETTLVFNVDPAADDELEIDLLDYASNLSICYINLHDYVSDAESYLIDVSCSGDYSYVTGDGWVYADEEVTLTAVADDEETFYGWIENNEVISTEPVLTFTPTADRELLAAFTPICTVTFDAQNGKEPETLLIPEGLAIPEPEEPEKEGFYFIGWLLGEENYDFYTLIEGDITLTAAWSESATPFVDVVEDSWYEEAVIWAVKNDITSGTDKTHFSPDWNCTRSQVVQFLYNAAGNPAPTGTVNPFVDVKESDWFYDAVLWAVENDITSGTDETHFSPDKVCTRAEVVMFLWNAAGNPAPTSTVNPFEDVKSTDWFYEAVLWAVENEITSGTDATHFSPAMTCTRAQIVVFLYSDDQARNKA